MASPQRRWRRRCIRLAVSRKRPSRISPRPSIAAIIWRMGLGPMKSLVSFEIEDNIAIVAITRPEVRNAVNRETAEALADMFRRFENDDSFRVAILTGAG